MALFGGVALIVPVLIMAFHPTRNTCLITTTVATLLFALILAFEARDSRGKDVLTATAAYAAVLVVFIGTSLAGSPLTANAASSEWKRWEILSFLWEALEDGFMFIVWYFYNFLSTFVDWILYMWLYELCVMLDISIGPDTYCRRVKSRYRYCLQYCLLMGLLEYWAFPVGSWTRISYYSKRGLPTVGVCHEQPRESIWSIYV